MEALEGLHTQLSDCILCNSFEDPEISEAFENLPNPKNVWEMKNEKTHKNKKREKITNSYFLL